MNASGRVSGGAARLFFALLSFATLAACREPDASPPAAPTALTASPVSTSTIRLTWVDPTNEEDGFKIERSLWPSSGFAEVATVAANTTVHEDAALAALTTYYYRVKAFSGAGESAPSEVASATTLPEGAPPDSVANLPAAPTTVTASALSRNAIRVSWVDSSTSESGFRIERSLSLASGFEPVAVVPADVTVHDDTALTASTTYHYRIRSYTGAGESAPSPVASATTLADPPALLGVEPRLAIPNQYLALEVTGARLVTVPPGPGQNATLTLFQTSDLDGNPVSGPSWDIAATVSVEGGVHRATALIAVAHDAPAGLYGVRFQRSDGEVSSFANALAVLIPGAATAVDAEAVCVRAPEPQVGITGIDFLVVDGKEPTVTLTNGLRSWDPHALTAVIDATPSGCRQVPFERADVRLCTRLDVAVPRDARAMMYDLHITQPPPVSAANSSAISRVRILLDGAFPLAPFPQVRSAVDAPLELAVFDSRFTPDPLRLHRAQASPPTVLIDNQPAEFAMSDCSPSEFPGHEWCGNLTVTIPKGYPEGAHTITVSTMPGCSGATTVALGGRPVIDSVDPTFTCLNDGDARVLIRGSNFFRPSVFVGGREATRSWSCGDTPCNEVAIYGGRAIGLPVGTYEVTVVNGTIPPTPSTTSAQLSVEPGPPLIWAPVPSHIYAGIETQVSFLFSGGAVYAAELVPSSPGSAAVPVQFVTSEDRISVTVPAGLGEDSWELAVHGDGPCVGTSDGWLRTHATAVVWAWDFDAQPHLSVVDEDGASGPTDHLLSGGNPGGAVGSSGPDGGPVWYFAMDWIWHWYDLAGVGFDLRASGAGAEIARPGVLLIGPSLTIERNLDPPPVDAWTRYFVSLDDPTGWTRRSRDGAVAPATLGDLRVARDDGWEFWIRGRWTSGAGEAALDNLSVELRH